MKRIHFDNVNGNWKAIIIMLLAMIFVLIGSFEIIGFHNPKMNKIISAIGFFIQAIYFSKMFWHKNYIQWNKKGIVIRIKSILGKSLKFDEIKATELNGKKLTITKFDGNEVLIDLDEIAESDSKKLNEILIENTIANSKGIAHAANHGFIEK